ncbi:hypothetical protein AURDEDRAFT_127895 [Auricularia subglabra TFB-10046 SS5]|nr:hypothetical protein AURDEDRAFT_127895 [Auricularia subglabra TFB-10046 SS5]
MRHFYIRERIPHFRAGTIADFELRLPSSAAPMLSELTALRTQLAVEFKRLSHGVDRARQLKNRRAPSIRFIADQLAQASVLFLSDLVQEWARVHDPLFRLPNELVALCFTHLPLRDRIAASHVSRHWRAVSLASPAMWAHIDLSEGFRDVPAILSLALSRTGHRPVDIYFCPPPDFLDFVSGALADHISHIRTLWCSFGGNPVPLSLPAPLLCTLMGIRTHVVIPSDFLGGVTGNLRTLSLGSVTLPPVCPALSTVTSLTLMAPPTDEEAAPFSRLFLLCPALESLSLHMLQHRFSHHLPEAPAPRNLRKIRLDTIDELYDLTRHYLEWRSETLLDVEIEQQRVPCPQSLQTLFSGAVALTVGHEYSLDRMYFIARHPEWRRMIHFDMDDENATASAEMVMAAKSSLLRVWRMEVPLPYLDVFVPVLAALPKLQELTVFTKADSDMFDHVGASPHVFDWAALEPIVRVSQLCAKLEVIVVEVVCWAEHCPPREQDARDLLATLAGMNPSLLPCVRVKGFSEDALREVEIPHFEGFEVEFEMPAEK